MSRIEQSIDLTVLIGRMHSDLQVYCEAVERLSHRDVTSTLDAIYERSEHARIAFEFARDRLRAYIAEHGGTDAAGLMGIV
jgi:transcriptional regulator